MAYLQYTRNCNDAPSIMREVIAQLKNVKFVMALIQLTLFFNLVVLYVNSVPVILVQFLVIVQRRFLFYFLPVVTVV